MRTTAVISFCSNDWRFLQQCIGGVAPFCEQVIITVCDHFFDGTKENYALLEEAFRRFPQCTFLEFQYDPDQSYRMFSPHLSGDPHWTHEWHNTGRWLSYLYSSSQTEFLFFLDCDEIVDNVRFHDWLHKTHDAECSAYRFAGLWHFREAKFEACVHDDVSLLVRKKAIDPLNLWSEDERMGLLQLLSGEKHLGVRGGDGLPLIHHYSGVRTQEEFLKKFSSWGHHWERDWNSLIREEFSRPFNGRDFIRHYEYREVEPIFDPLSECVPVHPTISYEEHLQGLHRFPNVSLISKKDAFKRQLEHEFKEM
jgi:hypothetical protein